MPKNERTPSPFISVCEVFGLHYDDHPDHNAMEALVWLELTKFWVHVHHIAIREYKLLFSLFLAHQYDVDLLRRDGQHRKVNAVELVKTAPTS